MKKYIIIIFLSIFFPFKANASCLMKAYEEITSACTKAHSFIPASTTWVKTDSSFKYQPLDKGHSWRGKWRTGEPIGFGIYKVEDKYDFIGMIRDREPNGDGKLIIKGKEGTVSLVGFFYDGHINGKAKVYYHNFTNQGENWSYEGETRKTTMHGFGKLVHQSGSILLGKFEENQFINGQFKFPNGNVYEGEVLNFRPHGKGTIFYQSQVDTDLDFSEGTFENGWQVSGTLTYADGSFYKGDFKKKLASWKRENDL